MTERKPPTKVADELFDRDHLSDSDSDFLSELDRVLAGQSSETPDTEAVTEFLEPGGAASGDELDLELGDWKDPFAAPVPEEPPKAEAPVPAPEREQAPEEPEPDAPFSEEPWGVPQGPAAETPTETADTPPETTGEGEAEPPMAEPPRGRELLQEPDHAAPALAAAAGSAAAAAIPPPRSAQPEAAAPSPRPLPTMREGSPAWSGALALLALLGMGLGGAGLWRAAVLEQRLADLGLESAPARAISAPAASAAGTGRTEIRLDALQERVDVEIAQISGELEELERSLTRQIQGHRPAPAPERDDTPLAELHVHLEQVQEHLAELERQMAARPAPAQVAEPRPAAPARTAKAAPAPVSKPGRTWAVNLMSLPQEEAADRELRRLRADGLPAQKRTVEKDGQTWYRIAVGGFDDFDTAKQFAAQVRGRPGIGSVWIGRE